MFRLKTIVNGKSSTPEFCRMPATANEAYKIGEALVITAGCVTAATGSAKPRYIAAETYTAPASGARGVYCYAVSPAMHFEVPLSVSPGTLTVGTALTIAAGGLSVTASSGGHATVVSLDGAAASGDRITVTID